MQFKYCFFFNQLEPEEEASEAAVREVLEEAGVRGQLGTCLGVFEVMGNFKFVFIISFNTFVLFPE